MKIRGLDLRIGYNVSRPLPFRWFTLFVVIEFVVGLVVFSLISVATSGYEKISIYTGSPNSTESRKIMPGMPDVITSKTKPSCQSIEVDVGTSFTTNNSALTYLLTRVQQDETVLSSLVYHDNKFENCVVNDILINIESLGRNAAQIAVSDYGAELSSSVSCVVASDGGPARVNLTAGYNYVPASVAIYDRLASFPGRDRTGKASLFWAEEALALHWSSLTDTYKRYMNGSVAGDYQFTKGALYFTPGPDVDTDITSSAFFGGVERLISVSDTDRLFVSFNRVPENMTALSGNRTEWLVDQTFWFPADTLAKVFHSTIMTDLGQTTYKPNIFTEADLLQHFTSNFSLINATISNFGGLLQTPGRITQDYNTLRNTTGPLGVSPSVISARYLCQEPRLKSKGDLVFSVIIADFVLLQVLWTVTMWIATIFAEHRSETATWCHGCLKLNERGYPPLVSDRGTCDQGKIVSSSPLGSPLEETQSSVTAPKAEHAASR